MELTSLELDDKEASKETVESQEMEKPKYPYGTCLYLNDESLEKLGIDSNPAVGTEMHIIAVAKVTGVSEREYEGGKHKTLDLQITDMAIAQGEESKPKQTMAEAATSLYPKQGQ